MNTELKQLLKEINDYQNEGDIDYAIFDKVKGELEFGAVIEVFWVDRDNPDRGYLFCLPNQNTDEYDACVHIPQMDNSDGIGNGGEVFKHLYEIVSLPRVLKIEVL